MRYRDLLRAAADVPAPGGGGGAPPPETPPAPPPPTPPTPEKIELTSEQLKDRMSRSHNAQLKKYGLDSDDDLAKLIKERDDRVKADEEARRAQMTREQQLETDKNAAEARAVAAQAQADEARFEAHVTKICLEKGIRNLSYAKYLVGEAADAIPDGQQLDAADFLGKQLADPQTLAALGATAPVVPPEPVTVPGHTGPNFTPPAPPPPGGNNTPADAFKMDAGAWAARKAALGMA